MLTRADLTQVELHRAMLLEDRLLAKRIMPPAVAAEYVLTCIMRARSYAAHLQVMTIPLYLREWVKTMIQASGKTRLIVHHNELSWLEAFMVVRYGEAVEHWPMTLTKEDVERAHKWKNGKIPGAIMMEE